MASTVKALDGVTVVAIEHAVASPFASRQLADLGARVIKIERPGLGDFARSYDSTVNGMSSHFVWLNRSKESLSLDLKCSEGATVLQELLGRADVFIHNLAPGAVGRLGFDGATLRTRHPHLIICEISGYGVEGPYANRKAYDLLVQSETGLLSITGERDAPAKVGIAVADIAAGMYAFSSILSALMVREKTGKGLTVNVSLFDSLAEWMGYPAYYTAYGGVAPPPTGARHAAIAPYGPYGCGDGKIIYLGVQNQGEWERFCDVVLQRPGLVSDERFGTNVSRVEHGDELDRVIREHFSGLTADEVMAKLEAAEIAHAQMNSVEQFLHHPQLVARDRWSTVSSPVGDIRALRPPFDLEGVEVTMGPVPAVGEHTDAILHELGITAATIAEWRRQGVV
jgi:itaconate CoA-transferase